MYSVVVDVVVVVVVICPMSNVNNEDHEHVCGIMSFALRYTRTTFLQTTISNLHPTNKLCKVLARKLDLANAARKWNFARNIGLVKHTPEVSTLSDPGPD